MLFSGTVDRVRALHLHCDWPIKKFFDRAAKAPCVCAVNGGLFESLKAGVEWHDKYEFYGEEPPSRVKLGSWFDALLGGVARS